MKVFLETSLLSDAKLRELSSRDSYRRSWDDTCKMHSDKAVGSKIKISIIIIINNHQPLIGFN